MAKSPPRYFKKIYKLYVEKIYRFIFIKVNSKQTAEDLTSEVFLRFWKKIKNSNPKTIENPKAFLYKTARNLVIDHYRSYSAKKEVSIEEIKEMTDVVHNSERKDLLPLEIEEVRRAVSKLKEDYQDVILWYYLDNLSVEEIAKILGKSENAVRVMIHRAINSLKEHLGV